MAYQGISLGTAPNDGTGDSLYNGALKINANFGEIYDALGDGVNLDVEEIIQDVAQSTISSAISSGIKTGITVTYDNINNRLNFSTGSPDQINLADNRILSLGSAADFELFHNGTHNYMDLNVGNLYIRDNTTTRFTFEKTTGKFEINSIGAGAGLRVLNNQPSLVDGQVLMRNTSTTFSTVVNNIQSHRSATDAYNFIVCASNVAGSADNEFRVTGDGRVFADIGYYTGADYAEYFEWEDGNPNNEDRRGMTVSLVGNKIKIAEEGDSVIGAISARPVVIGDDAWDHWTDKYLKDEYGNYILETYTITKWSYVNENGDTIELEYPSDQIPSDIQVPPNATIFIHDNNHIQLTRKVLNPEWNESVEYIPREKRKEWGIVGLVGKLRIQKNQIKDSRWIKMRDISDSVEEWLLR
jgi:hypothetical protein